MIERVERKRVHLGIVASGGAAFEARADARGGMRQTEWCEDQRLHGIFIAKAGNKGNDVAENAIAEIGILEEFARWVDEDTVAQDGVVHRRVAIVFVGIEKLPV